MYAKEDFIYCHIITKMKYDNFFLSRFVFFILVIEFIQMRLANYFSLVNIAFLWNIKH